mmetsp:Transcript_31310/g.45023  ORF Transcript_31310/g.45023 Transcript_31310/m.45023 type:complete len:310 (-) Transcript_31310:740-1669(-)
MRSHRCSALDRVRGFLSGLATGPNGRLQQSLSGGVGRGPSWRQDAATQGHRGPGRGVAAAGAHGVRLQLRGHPQPQPAALAVLGHAPPAFHGPHAGRQGRVDAPAHGGGPPALSLRAHGQRGPALHPVHLGLHRQAQGRAAHHRRVPPERRHDHQVLLRPAGGGRVLLCGRLRLDHGPLLHRVRPPLQRGHVSHVREHPHLPQPLQVLGHDPATQDHPVLHRTHCNPGPDAVPDRAAGLHGPELAAGAGQCGRAHQPAGLALAARVGGRGPLLCGGHLLADRDRRPPGHQPARCCGYEAGIVCFSLFWH